MLDRLPHMSKHNGWHIRVANQIVGLPYQFFISEPANCYKCIITVGDPAVEVGGRDQPLLIGERSFALGNGQIYTYIRLPLFSL